MNMETSVNHFVWKYSARQQMLLVMLTLLYFPTLYALLELPKIIINRVISQPDSHSILDIELSAETMLVALTLLIFVLYLFNAVVKLVINIRKGVIGERLIRRLRYTLLDNLLRFPVQRFRVVSQGELISQINSETETLAGYISESVTLPLFQGGTMLTVLTFMFIQSVWLGLAAVALIPIQMLIIPRMQQKINVLNHQRLRQVRIFSEYIGETVSGAQAIRTHGVQRYTLSGYSTRLNKLLDVRLKLYRQKYMIKFVNNFINQLTPILFYLVGGILVIRGHLSIGALVAAIAGHKDVVAPWKELLKYYQMQQDAKIKYEQLIEQFTIPDSDESDYYATVPGRDAVDLFPLKLNNVVTEEDGQRILGGFNLTVNAGEHIAIVEPESAKRQHIAEILLSLRDPAYGSVWLGDQPIKEVPGLIKSRRIAFQASSPPIFNVSAYENIFLSIKHVPEQPLSGKEGVEATLSGNSTDTYAGEWNDYEAYRFDSDDELYDWYVKSIQATDADLSVIRNGLFQFLAEDYESEQANKLVLTRPAIHKAMIDKNLSFPIFDEREWCHGLSIAENLAFGKLVVDGNTPGDVLYSDEVARILSYNGFDHIVEKIGKQIATMIIRGLSSELTREDTMQEFRLSSAHQAQNIVVRARSIIKKPSSQLTESDRHFLLLLFLNLVLDDHPVIQLPGSVVSRITFTRDEIDNVLTTQQREKMQRFEYSQYHPGLTVLENLLFGVLPDNLKSQSLDALLDVVDQVIKDAGLSRDIMLLTLRSTEVGISGSRLSATARQNMPLASVLLKEPEIIVFNDGLNSYDEKEQFRIKSNIRRLLPDTSIIWLTSKLDDHSQFDRVIDTRDSH